jgi:FKBP-type peptidyl-prolyl cis-trans isomerase
MPNRKLRTASHFLGLLAAIAGMSDAGAVDPVSGSANPPAVTPEMGSFDVGLLLGSQLEHNGMAATLSLDDVVRGLKEGLAGHPMTAGQRDAAQRFMRDSRDSLAESNRAAGRAFLERNMKEPGVKTMPSGLQYRVLADGVSTAKSPSPTDQVTVRYRASLADGIEFDRSETHDRPATFRVNSVFKGWQEAFLAMKPGAKWQLFVPPELGYGANPPPMVPPGALLVYELELLQVEPAAPLDPAAVKRVPTTGVRPAIKE